MTAPTIATLDNDPSFLAVMHDLLAAAGHRTLRCRPRDVTNAHAVVRRARAPGPGGGCRQPAVTSTTAACTAGGAFGFASTPASRRCSAVIGAGAPVSGS